MANMHEIDLISGKPAVLVTAEHRKEGEPNFNVTGANGTIPRHRRSSTPKHTL